MRLRAAIGDWFAQMYRQLELVLVYDEWDAEAAQIAREAQQFSRDAGVDGPWGEVRRLVTPVPNRRRNATLGALRNLAVSSAKGHFVTQWDDDDSFDPRRVHEMLLALESAARASGKRAVVLSRWLVLDTFARRAFLTGEARPGVWTSKEGSILAERSLLLASPYPESKTGVMVESAGKSGPSHVYGEDSVMLNGIRPLVHQMAAPYLYTYVVHGNNTCDQQHFDQLWARTQRRHAQELQWVALPRFEYHRLHQRYTERLHAPWRVGTATLTIAPRLLSAQWWRPPLEHGKTSLGPFAPLAPTVGSLTTSHVPSPHRGKLLGTRPERAGTRPERAGARPGRAGARPGRAGAWCIPARGSKQAGAGARPGRAGSTRPGRRGRASRGRRSHSASSAPPRLACRRRRSTSRRPSLAGRRPRTSRRHSRGSTKRARSRRRVGCGGRGRRGAAITSTRRSCGAATRSLASRTTRGRTCTRCSTGSARLPPITLLR